MWSPFPTTTRWRPDGDTGLDWANRSGDVAVCRRCGFVHTFFEQVEWRVPDAGSQVAEP